MTPLELCAVVRRSDIYKMSLGKSARYQQEALENGVLIFQSERRLYDAVALGDEQAIADAGRKVITDRHPRGNAPNRAIDVWRSSIETFRTLPASTLILHWEADLDHLHWGITGEGFSFQREDAGEWKQPGLLFYRPLLGGWRKTSIGDVPLSNLHPKARDYAINLATLNRVQSDPDYFRALILDADTTAWEAKPEWIAKASSSGWRRKDRDMIRAARHEKNITPAIREAVDHFLEIRRMAATAIHTVAHANGQLALTTIKSKDIEFSKEELEREIHALLKLQDNCCALTSYNFDNNSPNPHLKMSLDRKNSDLGYVPGNLQVVTRAANFFKSASDETDWHLKAIAMEKMVLAMRKTRKAAQDGSMATSFEASRPSSLTPFAS